MTRGSAPGPRWGLCPQTPIIGSCSALAMVPPATNPSAAYGQLNFAPVPQTESRRLCVRRRLFVAAETRVGDLRALKPVRPGPSTEPAVHTARYCSARDTLQRSGGRPGVDAPASAHISSLAAISSSAARRDVVDPTK